MIGILMRAVRVTADIQFRCAAICCYTIAFLLSLMVTLGSALQITAQPENQGEFYVAYQVDDTIYRLNISQNTSEILVSGVDGVASFSPDNRWMAYRTDDALWVSALDMPQFFLAFENPGIPDWNGLTWTPDGRSLIFSYAERVPQGASVELAESYILNLDTREVRSWQWGDCHSIVQQISTGRLGMLCSSVTAQTGPDVGKMVLEGSGRYLPFHSSDYRVLVPEAFLNYDWRRTSEFGEVLAYFGTGFLPKISVITGGDQARSIILKDDRFPYPYGIAVSSDGRMVAYATDTLKDASKCLQISDVLTGSTILPCSDTVSLKYLYVAEWNRSNRFIAFLGSTGTSGTSDVVVGVLDVQTGEHILRNIGMPTGPVAIVQAG